jgi:hypothetical protein
MDDVEMICLPDDVCAEISSVKWIKELHEDIYTLPEITQCLADQVVKEETSKIDPVGYQKKGKKGAWGPVLVEKKLVKLTLLAIRKRERKGPEVQCWSRRESQECKRMGEECLRRPKTRKRRLIWRQPNLPLIILSPSYLILIFCIYPRTPVFA